MADVDRTSVVSNETLKELCANEIKSNELSGSLSECSVTNRTNACSNRIVTALTDAKDADYREIDSFSELSFKTNDEVSLQDLIESEFATRISAINDDDIVGGKADCWSNLEPSKSHDSFDDLFSNFDYKEKENGSEKNFGCTEVPTIREGETVSETTTTTTNLDDFISGPMRGETALITDYLDDHFEKDDRSESPSPRANTKSVNIFKCDTTRKEIPFFTNFDPFTAIEEDSEFCDNSITEDGHPDANSSPDEFPFPGSPEETKSWEVADDSRAGTACDKAGNRNHDCLGVNKSNDVMREFFCKRISDENLECSTSDELNCGRKNGHGENSKFHVAGRARAAADFAAVDGGGPTPSADRVSDLDEFHSLEDIFKGEYHHSDTGHEVAKSEAEPKFFRDHASIDEIFPPPSRNVRSCSTGIGHSKSDYSVRNTFSGTQEDKWTTVEDVLNARSDESNSKKRLCLVDVTNECDKTINSFGDYTNSSSAAIEGSFDYSESDSDAGSQSELTDKKAIKKKKTKKGKKSEEKENISVKSSFNKFDQLTKKTILHVRSVDASKVQKQFNEAASGILETASTCKSCGKQVFQMEQVKAEKSLWHKNCFRCHECSKQLSVDTYSSHEGIVYCKPHFKELFKPRVVLENDSETAEINKSELIVRENQPIELPPEVVRASEKPDLGLDELASLNLKSRYQIFEKGEDAGSESLEKSPISINVKRSPSILSKLAKFQKKGIDVGVRDEELNGLPIEQSSSSGGEEDEDEGKDDKGEVKIVKSKKVKERPMSFSKMGDVKSVWESGKTKTREDMREERKAEIHQIRTKLFMGKQIKMKEAYEQAVRGSENSSPKKSIDVKCDKTRSIKECFEKGEPLNFDDEIDVEETKKKGYDKDMSLFEAGLSKQSRSLFLELDKSAKNEMANSVGKAPPSKSSTQSSPRAQEVSPQLSENIVKCSDTIEDVQIETADISSKFKFFETYKEPEREKKKFRITPPREGQIKGESPDKEIYRDPDVVRASDKSDREIIRTNTTSKMLSLFRRMEEKTEEIPKGRKPLKRFTPPPDYRGCSDRDSVETNESEGDDDDDDDDEEEEDNNEEEEERKTNPNLIRSSDRVEDEYLNSSGSKAERAKQLRAKFEKWEEKNNSKERGDGFLEKINGFPDGGRASSENSENIEVTSIQCTKSLRERFESMKGNAEQGNEAKRARPKVSRFVEIQNNMAELCDVCRGRVYHLEKIETSGKIFHRACFRCMQCKCLLRIESFTLNCGNLYCLPHFKQKFISKGNYDEGFGVDQHKAKWLTVTSF